MRSGEKMPDTLYDTRFFIATYTAEPRLRPQIRSELGAGIRKYVSAMTIHEVYRISLEDEGRDVARIRKSALEKDFEIIDVDSDIAAESAEIKVSKGRDFPIADAIIAATAQLKKLVCFTDDDHIKSITTLKTRWFPR
jgi:predicted nucleic acid-binding protein